jgi:hypothetical protein
LGLPGADQADETPKGAAAKISMPAPREAESRRAADAPVAIGAGSDAKPRTHGATRSVAIGTGSATEARNAPKVNRMGGPDDPKQDGASGEARRLPEGVEGMDPRAPRRLPRPFRLADWFFEEKKPDDPAAGKK